METAGEQNTSSFERQFSRVKMVNTASGFTKVVDLEPQFPKNTVPILLALGWGETLQTYKDSLRELYNTHRRVIAVDHPRRGQGIIAEESDYPMAEVRKMQSLIGAMNNEKVDTVDVIAHSEGAINVIIAATLYPERFRNIVLVNPRGLMGQETRYGLIGRFMVILAQDAFKYHINIPRDEQGVPITSLKGRAKYFTGNPKQLKQEVADLVHEKGRLVNAAIECAKYFAKNPKRTMEELAAMAESNITAIIKNLHDNGIGISVIQMAGDSLFQANGITNALKNAIDGFYSVKGGHHKFFADMRYMQLAIDSLDSLHTKHQTKVAASNPKS